MLSKRMEKALNEQVNAELYSGYLYFSMAAYFTELNLAGFARWMECQALEEQYHAMKIYKFINSRGGRAIMAAIKAPPAEWDSPLAVFEATGEHEATVTGMINNLVDLAIKDKDHATNNFLQWYVAEQVEEEASAAEVVQKLKLMGQAPGGLFMIDQELGQRVFAVPPDVTIIAAGA